MSGTSDNMINPRMRKVAPRPSHTADLSPKVWSGNGIHPFAHTTTMPIITSAPTTASTGVVRRSVRLVRRRLPVSRRACGRKSSAMSRMIAGMASVA
jgi:hypothetical protein